MSASAVGDALLKKYIIRAMSDTMAPLINCKIDITVQFLISLIYDGEISLIPRSASPTDLSEVRALLRLPETSRLDALFDIKKLTIVPLHLYDEFVTEWENNFINKIIRDQFKRRNSRSWDDRGSDPEDHRRCYTARRAKINAAKIDAAVTNALTFSDSEDDAFSA